MVIMIMKLNIHETIQHISNSISIFGFVYSIQNITIEPNQLLQFGAAYTRDHLINSNYIFDTYQTLLPTVTNMFTPGKKFTKNKKFNQMNNFSRSQK